MANFEEALKITLFNEGGSTNKNYTNRSDDGETYCGICRKYHPDWKGWKIIDSKKDDEGFPKCLDSIAELKTLVILFYRSEFWDKLKCGDIRKQNVANKLFDISVNIGLIAANFMQRAVNVLRGSMGKNFMTLIDVDGVLGNESIKAINMCNSEMLLDEFKKLVIKYYMKKSNPKYINGWIKRVEQ
jgi:lysozyme family protein